MKRFRPGVSRRRLAALLAGAGVRLPAQTPAPADELAQAKDRYRQSAAAVRRVDLDPGVEPAFVFKA